MTFKFYHYNGKDTWIQWIKRHSVPVALLKAKYEILKFRLIDGQTLCDTYEVTKKDFDIRTALVVEFVLERQKNKPKFYDRTGKVNIDQDCFLLIPDDYSDMYAVDRWSFKRFFKTIGKNTCKRLTEEERKKVLKSIKKY